MGNGKKKFVLIGTPRVGSNYLISRINQHPDILCHYELYSVNHVYTAFPEHYTNKGGKGEIYKDKNYRDRNPLEFLNKIYADSSASATGFNIFPKQNDLVLEHVINNPDIYKIFIQRKNLLNSYLSLQIATKHNAWNSLKSSKIPLKDKVFHLDCIDFELYIQGTRSFYSRLKDQLLTSGQTYLAVEYEELVKNSDALLNIFEYLNQTPYISETATVFKKENNNQVFEIVSNYQELYDFCRNKGYDFL